MGTLHRLDGGLRVVVERVPHRRSVGLGLWVAVGSRYEGPGLQGAAHMVEHVAFKGTRRLRSALDIAVAIEQVGGDCNAETGKELTGYLAKVPRDHWLRGLEVLWELATAPLLRQRDVTSERRVVLEELAEALDTPSDHVHDLLAETLWPEHPLGRCELGTAESLAGLGQAELRAFVRDRYVPAAMVLSVAGDLEVREVIDAVAERARRCATPAPGAAEPPSFEPAAAPAAGPAVQLKQRDTEETQLCLGLRTVARGHPDRPALEIVRLLLGEGMSSRLFQEVRERRGLAYTVTVDEWSFYDAGALEVYAGVAPRKARACLRTVLREMARLASEPPPAREIADAVEKGLGYLALRLEDTEELSDWLARGVLLEGGKVRSFDALAARLRAVTPDDVARVARAYLTDDRLCLAVIGPHRSAAPFREALTFGR
jgi:predicted Zn-dependent peptidase